MGTTREPFPQIARLAPTARGQRQDGLGAVQEFLTRFGYLSRGDYVRDELDGATEKALSTYQERMGQPVTGDFDEATRRQMTTHRCGMPDVRDGVAFATTCSWDRVQLSYAFETGTGDSVGEFGAVRNAFATWSEVVPLTFVEVGTDDNPDLLVDWRPAADPDHSMVGGVLAHADFPPGCSVVTNSLPKPLHFDDSEHLWVNGSVVDGFDIETVALHEIGHLIGLAHSNVNGSVMFPTVSDNFTKRELTADDIAGAQDLYGAAAGLLNGTFTLRQVSSGRFLDAHEIASEDFRVVTRPAQNNDTQRWQITPVGVVYLIQQRSSQRFVDAHEAADKDFSVVTRTAQNNDTQQWVILHDPDTTPGTVRVQQLSNGRFLDAHQVASEDFRVVTRTAQNNDTQLFTFTPSSGGTFTIRQVSSGRFLDAHEIASQDFRVVTRPAQNNNTQRWSLTRIGGVYRVQQVSSGRFVDAHQTASEDFRVVTRTSQDNATQLWAMLPVGGDREFTMQQVSGGRFVDAHQTAAQDFSVVTRDPQNNDTQRWRVDPT
jgi:hypothetical protein